MVRIIFLFLFISLSGSCNKERLEEYTGIIKDYTGLDGCGLVIVLDNGANLEPAAVPVNITLIADKRVSIKYRILTHRVSNCMVGSIVEVVRLRYL